MSDAADRMRKMSELRLPAAVEPTIAPTTEQLASCSDDDLRALMDWWALGNRPVVGYTFWYDELRRRAEERLTAELIEATQTMASIMEDAAAQSDAMVVATRKMESLTRDIKLWTIINGVVAAAALIVALVALTVNV